MRPSRRAKSNCAGSSQHRPFCCCFFIPDVSEPSQELTCIRSSRIGCTPADEALCGNLQHELGVLIDSTHRHAERRRVSGDGPGRIVRTSAVAPELIIEPSLRHSMDVLVSLLLALSICNLRCAAMQFSPIQSDPILRSRANGSLETQQPTVFMRTSNPGSHPQSAQPRLGTAREHLPRSLPPRASPLPP